MNRRYDVGIYVRLSVEDSVNSAKRGRGNPFQNESTSIENQRVILSEYAMLRGWNVVQIYSDDGFSGGNFHRPGFLQMVEDARAGKIDLILVKDLSRLGRDYIEVGRYTDEVFPALGCRFIALMDDIDSQGHDDFLPFRSLLNDYHLKDLSRKIKSVLHAKARAGAFVGAFAPYGYAKSPLDKGRLVIDPEAAEVVKRIFQLRVQGTSYAKITAALNQDGVLAPRAYYYHQQGEVNPYNVAIVWKVHTVKTMLRSEAYLGHSVKLKKATRSYKDRSLVNRPEEGWIRVENTHEPIIPQDVWDTAQQVNLFRYDPALRSPQEPGLFSGLLVCSDCGGTMSCNTSTKRWGEQVHKYRSYFCNLHKHTGGTVCSWHTISECVLLQLVQEDVRSQLKFASANEDFIAQQLRQRMSLPSLDATKKELAQLSERITELETLGVSLYEDRLAGGISLDSFQALSAAADEDRSQKQAERERLEAVLTAAKQATSDVSEWVSHLREFLSLEQPDSHTLHAMIDKIVIGEREGLGKERRQEIRIVYRFVGEIGR